MGHAGRIGPARVGAPAKLQVTDGRQSRNFVVEFVSCCFAASTLSGSVAARTDPAVAAPLYIRLDPAAAAAAVAAATAAVAAAAAHVFVIRAIVTVYDVQQLMGKRIHRNRN